MNKKSTAVELAVDIGAVDKRFGRKMVVAGLDLQIPAGMVYGLLGPAEAGKTTILNLLVGLTWPSAGKVMVLGRRAFGGGQRAARTGYASSAMILRREMTGEKYLKWIAGLRGVGGIDHLSGLCQDLDLALGCKIKRLSDADKTKLSLVAALIDDPELLVLDEVMRGMNPIDCRRVQAVIRGFAGRGKTVVVASEQLSDLEELSDRIGILRQGRLVLEVDVRETERLQPRRVTLFNDRPGLKLLTPPEHFAAQVIEHGRTRLVFEVGQIDGRLLRWIAMQPVKDMLVHRPGLEKIYHNLYELGGDGGEKKSKKKRRKNS